MTTTSSAPRPHALLITLAIALLAAGIAFAQGATNQADPDAWPQFRGPQQTGKVDGAALASSWPADGPSVNWRVPLGSGFSSISAVDGRLFTLFGERGSSHVGAFDASTGKRLWTHRLGKERRDQFGDGPRATPTVHDGVVYAVGELGALVALDAATGKVRWQHDLADRFDARIPTWGISSSPLVVDDLLLHNVGGKRGYLIVAFNLADGKVAWHTGSGKPGYATPLDVTLGGVRQAVFFAGEEIISVKPDDGTVLWQRPWRTSYDVNAAMPIFLAPDKIFISSGYDVGAIVLQVAKRSDGSLAVETAWKGRGMKNQYSSSVLHDGTIYGFDDSILKAIDPATGDTRWRARGFGHGSLIYADGHLIVLGDRGKLALVEASPTGYVEKASTDMLSGKHWTAPTLYDGQLLIRNEKELISLKVSTSGGESSRAGR
ncbi:MAG: PQQ-binding-like beta-propeller repeat protein [Acidobacteriota bacterium]